MSERRETTDREWIIVREPGCSPVVKRPGLEADGTTLGMLRALIACSPEGTQFTLVRVTAGGDLWADDGREWLNIVGHGRRYVSRNRRSA